jgi:hypothetical protein
MGPGGGLRPASTPPPCFSKEWMMRLMTVAAAAAALAFAVGSAQAGDAAAGKAKADACADCHAPEDFAGSDVGELTQAIKDVASGATKSSILLPSRNEAAGPAPAVSFGTATGPGGGTGRRCGLKIRWPRGRTGSSPVRGTKRKRSSGTARCANRMHRKRPSRPEARGPWPVPRPLGQTALGRKSGNPRPKRGSTHTNSSS